MTVVMILLCLAIAGRELYLAFERRRGAGAPEIADIRTQLAALKGTRDEFGRFRSKATGSLEETDARIRSLIAQINDRMVPDVNERLGRQREAVERLGGDVAALRAHLVRRLDQAVAASLGADPVDFVAGALAAEPSVRPALAEPYERFAAHYGLRVELADHDRYYLSGRSPRALESDFLDLLTALRTRCERTGGERTGGERTASPRAEGTGSQGTGSIGTGSDGWAEPLVSALRGLDRGGAGIGPLLLARTPGSLVCGVLPLAELLRPETARLLDDPDGAVLRLRDLPDTRACDLSSWPALH
ncbi:hypothetical protein [Actinomadura litoris]|uniref:Uncharacterized protein n=1 Tax=Actinomadura litoris TaxID=2678616 RepID=A0A7K1KUI2_9ACTN|nr:hypothetical protein [Actinomadura litoris]MUN35819.1 hypothetical protein [Actinomadura litoris]